VAAVLRGAMLAARSGSTAFNSRAGVLPHCSAGRILDRSLNAACPPRLWLKPERLAACAARQAPISGNEDDGSVPL
jgi:hypothetical protein